MYNFLISEYFFLLVITSVLHHDQVSFGPNIDPMAIVDKPIILWWTTYGGKSDEEITCGNVQCRVSVDRSLQFQNDVQVSLGLLTYAQVTTKSLIND